MIILFKYCTYVENYESFKGFDYMYVYIYIYIYRLWSRILLTVYLWASLQAMSPRMA